MLARAQIGLLRLDVEELKGVGPMIGQVEDQVNATVYRPLSLRAVG